MKALGAIVYELVETRCSRCECFPCMCVIETTRTLCVCGATIDSTDDLMRMYDAVVRHNAEPEHQRWRARRGW